MWPFDKPNTDLLPNVQSAPSDPQIDAQIRAYMGRRGTEKLGLCLVGGGAKGRWQIGFLARLNELGLLPLVDVIAGTSVGGLNGLVTSTYLNEFQKVIDIWRAIKGNSDVYSGKLPQNFFDIAGALLMGKLTGKSILDDTPLLNLIKKHLSGLDQLKIPVSVVTTERTRGRKVVLSAPGSSPIDMAMSTRAVPGAFPAYQDMYLDGGCSDNSPVDVLEQAGCTKIIVLYCDPDEDKKEAQVGPANVINNVLSGLNGMYAVQEDALYREIEMRRKLRSLMGEGEIEYAHCYPSVDTGQLLMFDKVELLQKGYDDAVAQVTLLAIAEFLK